MCIYIYIYMYGIELRDNMGLYIERIWRIHRDHLSMMLGLYTDQQVY